MKTIFIFLLPLLFAVLLPQPIAAQAKLYGVAINNQIVELNPTTGAVIKALSIPTDPNYEDGLAFDGKTLYYINGRTDAVGINKIIRIDSGLTQRLDTLPTVFPPRMDAVAINGNALYVLDFVQNKIYKVNLTTKLITDTLTLSFPAVGGISYGGSRNTLFVSSFNLNTLSNNKMYEINAETGAVINSFNTAYSAFGVAYSKSLNRLFLSTGSFLGQPTQAVNPDNGTVLYSFSGAYSALAADEANSVSGINAIPSPRPAKFGLEQNYPNPFNPSTTIRFSLASAQIITLKVYDMLGREVSTLASNERKSAGNYEANFRAERLSSGIYFYRLEARPASSVYSSANSQAEVIYTETKKMVFVK